MDESQRRALEQYYNQTSKPTVAQKDYIAKLMNLPGPIVHSWFTERRIKAREDKRVEEAQARAALENAHQIPAYDVLPIAPTRPKTHRTQSEASYASLARSLKAAAACMPNNHNIEYEQPLSDSSVYPYACSPSYSPTCSTFDMASSLPQHDSQWSNCSTPIDSMNLSSYPWSQSNYMPTSQAVLNTMIYEEPAQQESAVIDIPAQPPTRPRLQRTWTAPDNFVARQPAYRSATFPTDENTYPEALRIRRRPKLSPLGVGMARSRSSLGYENESISARRTPASSDFPYPLTPVRRVASSTAVPTLSAIPSYAQMHNAGSDEHCNNDAEVTSSVFEKSINNTDFDFKVQFPPSPISPEHGQGSQQMKALESTQLHSQAILDDVFTPPHTPLSALSASSENIVANTHDHVWRDNSFKMSDLDFLHNEMTLNDVFSDEIMAMDAY